ncbi:hypothetical protein BG003_009144, partial [Podila horticola]
MKTLSCILVLAAALVVTQSAPIENQPPHEEGKPSQEHSIRGTYQYSDDHSRHSFTTKNGECFSLWKPGHISKVEVKGHKYKCYGYSDYQCHDPVQTHHHYRRNATGEEDTKAKVEVEGHHHDYDDYCHHHHHHYRRDATGEEDTKAKVE